MSNDNNIDPNLLGKNPGQVGGSGGFSLRPKISGIVSLNKNAKYAVAGAAAVIALIAAATFNNVGSNAMNGAKNAVANQGGDTKPVKSAPGSLWYESKPNTYDAVVGASSPVALAGAGVPMSASAAALTAASNGVPTGVPNLAGQAVTPFSAATAPRTSVGSGGNPSQTPQQAATQNAQQSEAARQAQDDLKNANDASLDVQGFNQQKQTGAAGLMNAAYPSTATNSTAPQLTPAAFGTANAARDDDQNKQERKDQFLRDQRLATDNDYNTATKTKPRSPYELKAGWLIPAAMISGLNSDLPGEVIAQVREPVYDSAGTGKLLIPGGARLIGVYDAHVAYGQERILVVWNRVIFDDGSSYNIKGMPGADQAGYAGFYDEVNNHYIKTFASAGVIALLSAGVQLSQPNNGASNYNQPSVSQTLGASLGQQIGQTGMTITQKNLNIQPTLTVAPGYRFNIMVTADCVLEPIPQ
ncbi:Conjugation TrbI family protein [Paraburkholderia tropica]|uniref:TrbI/VirB10 family protein n=1 Tax=Paraburkholderia tropica TaxID=92647 RepID=UPI001CAEBE0A|nr:TrbI/VirB10 family protein [Paraburkholderia tropica]CAG9229952.1 Conjugation TrbI family protein [Paraburkholderia tropica]